MACNLCLLAAMKTFRRIKIVCFILLSTLISCSTSKHADKNNAEKGNSSLSIEQIQKLAENKAFTITTDWAYPLGIRSINLIGNPNFIKFKNDSVIGFLPYFGTVHMAANYGGDGGISFEGIPEQYEVIPQKDGKEVKVKFEINNKMENFQVVVNLFKNSTANVSVNSAYRNSISYSGDFKESEEDKK